MEFPFNVSRTCRLRTRSGIIQITPQDLNANLLSNAHSYSRNHGHNNNLNNGKNQQQTELFQILDEVGKASARAQGLKQPVTCPYKLGAHSDQRVYLMVLDTKKVVGLIKVGRKKLFIDVSNMQNQLQNERNARKRGSSGMFDFDNHQNNGGSTREITPLCVLDFYINESCQRQGYGHKLFQYVLDVERVSASRVAYDRPSTKFIRFLDKHYNLKHYTPQNNNFVVFHKFFMNGNHDGRAPEQDDPEAIKGPQVPCPFEDPSTGSQERFKGILEGKYEKLSNNYNSSDSQQINSMSMSQNLDQMDRDRGKQFQQSVEFASGHLGGQCQDRQQTISPAKYNKNPESSDPLPNGKLAPPPEKSMIHKQQRRKSSLTQISDDPPDTYVYEQPDLSNLPDNMSSFFSSFGPSGFFTRPGPLPGPTAGAGRAQSHQTQTSLTSSNPIVMGKIAMQEDNHLNHDSNPNRSNPGESQNQNQNLNNSSINFKTTKQAVDAQVRKLRENHPVFKSDAVQELMQEQGLTEMRSLADRNHHHTRGPGTNNHHSRSLSQNNHSRETSLTRLGGHPGHQNQIHQNLIHGSHTRAIQREQGFTRPVYLHNREKHYSGSGVAGLLGSGNGAGGVASSYQRVHGNGAGILDGMRGSDVRKAHTRKGIL